MPRFFQNFPPEILDHAFEMTTSDELCVFLAPPAKGKALFFPLELRMAAMAKLLSRHETTRDIAYLTLDA